MSEENIIVLARKEDFDEMIRVLRACFPIQESPEEIKRNLSISRNFLAKANGEIIGTMSYTKSEIVNGKITDMPLYRREQMCITHGLAVLPKYRRRGIAERLVREAERDMCRNHIKGYIGNAASEEVAQWFVCKFGVRIKRLEVRHLTAVGVFIEKRFRQESSFEEVKKRVKQVVSPFLKKTYGRVRATLRESL